MSVIEKPVYDFYTYYTTIVVGERSYATGRVPIKNSKKIWTSWVEVRGIPTLGENGVIYFETGNSIYKVIKLDRNETPEWVDKEGDGFRYLPKPENVNVTEINSNELEFTAFSFGKKVIGRLTNETDDWWEVQPYGEPPRRYLKD